MKNIQRIMVALDFSEYAKVTLEHAVILARELKSELLAVNVINQRDIDIMKHTLSSVLTLRDTMTVEDWIEGVKEEREKELHKLEKSVDLTGLDFSFFFRKGYPFEEMLKIIAEHDIDMVVMGTKGKTDLSDFFAGTTATKMFKKCPVPLVTVRDLKKR